MVLKIAIQKSGRLSEQSLALLKECGIKVSNNDRKLKATCPNFPLEILFLRDDDIPQYVEQGVADLGILGENEMWEQNKKVSQIKKLDFAHCRMALAVPKEETYDGIQWLANKRIATSYPGILREFLDKNKISAFIEKLSGSVEIAPGIGLADAIFDIVSTGSTLIMNGLNEVETVCKSQAVLIGNKHINSDKKQILDRLLFRMEAVKNAAENKYIMMNAPMDKVDAISKLLPGMKSPTVVPLREDGWCSLQSVVKEDAFWEVIEQLKNLGAQGILVVPIEKMVL